MSPKEQLQELLDNYITGSISAADRQALLTMLNNPDTARQAEELMQLELESGRYEADMLPDVHARLHLRLQEVINATRQTGTTVPHPSLLRRLTTGRKWWAAAAVIVILLGAGIYRWLQHPQQPPVVTVPAQDVAPGSYKARLTLADGSVVSLDSAGNQTLQQGGTTVHKQGGQLRYDARGVPASFGYNTLVTPRGGQFQVTLPDGTRVWLNAASSIKYPVAFTGNERIVEITGEAYFEVAAARLGTGQKMPFKVNVNDACTVEVLGTHFNINAYEDEDAVRTTLLEGKVKVVNARPDDPVGRGEWSIIKPGEQAIISARDHSTVPAGKYSQLTIDHSPDTDQVMAWKNGAFSFENKSLEEVMRQLSRWYDIDVSYEGNIPSVTFVGEMGRDVNLSKVLDFLSESHIHFRMENGRRLVVTN